MEAFVWRRGRNLSVSGRRFPTMSTYPTTITSKDTSQDLTSSVVFGDPVAYLASFGIESELIEVQTLPAAA
jgi:hypothetical protein